MRLTPRPEGAPDRRGDQAWVSVHLAPCERENLEPGQLEAKNPVVIALVARRVWAPGMALSLRDRRAGEDRGAGRYFRKPS